MAVATPEARPRVNWRQVAQFLGLTFALTWLLNLFLWQVVGYGNPAMGLLLQLQMLLPAFSAMVLGLFAFQNGRINPLSLRGPSRVFVFYFLAYTLVYVALVAGSVIWPRQLQLFGLIGLALTLLGLLLVVLLRVFRGRGALAPIGVVGAKPRHWLLFGLGFVLFYGSQTLLNYLFNLGHAVDLAPIARQAMMPPDAFLVVALIQSVVLSPFLGLLIAFGEEYGWRGYLQGELVKLGKARGILLIGIIWGVWHAPIIVMGYNYPGYPVAGVFVMTGYTVMLAFVLGYAVLKTGSVWLAAYLHALNNQVFSTLVVLVYAPNDSIFSFGGGLYGIATMAVIVLLILRDPVWREAAVKPEGIE
ncbi:MAG: CPBP family intramembrane glutamic endopeptidase [Chloroflexota bacterium]